MARLTIVIDVDYIPAVVDPNEVAEDVVGEYNDWARHNAGQPAEFIGAAWGTPDLQALAGT